MSDNIRKGVYPASTRYTRMNNRKIYSGFTHKYVTVPEVALDFLEGKRGTIWDTKEKRDVTKEVLGNYIAQCFREDVETLGIEEMSELIKLVGPRMPRLYEDVHRGAQETNASKKRKEQLKTKLLTFGESTPEIEKQNRGLEMGRGWSLPELRKFYKMKKPITLRVLCLKCRRDFLSQASRICQNCKDKDQGGLQEFHFVEGKRLENVAS